MENFFLLLVSYIRGKISIIWNVSRFDFRRSSHNRITDLSITQRPIIAIRKYFNVRLSLILFQSLSIDVSSELPKKSITSSETVLQDFLANFIKEETTSINLVNVVQGSPVNLGLHTMAAAFRAKVKDLEGY